MRKRVFVNKRTQRKKHLFFILLLCLSFLGIGFSNISTGLGVGGALSLQKYKPVFIITLDNQNATTPNTLEIYEKYSKGYYLNHNNETVSNQMFTNSNPITISIKKWLYGNLQL